MDLRTQTAFIAALLSLALAVSVLLRPHKQRAHWLFGIFSLNFAIWYASDFLRSLATDSAVWDRINLTVAVLLPLTAVLFFGVFVDTRNRRMRILARSALLAALLILAAIATPYYRHPVVATALFVYVTVLVFAALFTLYSRGQATSSRLEGARLKYLAIVGALGGFFTLFEYLPYVGLDIPPVGTVLILVFLYVLSQSIVRYRLIDLYELTGRLGVLTALAFVLAAMLWILALVSEDRFFIHGVVSAFVVLILFDPVSTKVQEWISQVFFHERFELERTTQVMRHRLAHALEADDLGDILISGLADSRRVTHAAVYLAGPDMRAFFLKGHFGPSPAERIELAPARPLLDQLTKQAAVVLENVERELEDKRQRGLDREAETLHDVVATLEALNASMCLGIKGDRDELYGFFTVRDARARDAFSPEEVQLLAGLAAQAAVTIENSQLFQQMKERDRLAALGEMSAGLAHEIRNPLGAIKASAQYLTDGDHPRGGEEEFLNIIVEEVDRLNRVVESFLDYARPQKGDPEPVFVNAAIRRALQLLRAKAEAANIKLRITLDPDLPQVKIDAEHLQQVLINLVQNAIQAMPKGGNIEVETRTQDRIRIGGGTQRWVELRVRDSGPGIPADVLPNLFVPFVTTKQRGTGLGLAISQRIVADAGGRIEVRTRRRVGTTFIVLLPGHVGAKAQTQGDPPTLSESAAEEGEAPVASLDEGLPADA